MRAHHWLLLLAILLIVGGFFAMAVAVLKIILWVLGLFLLIGAIAGFFRNGP